MIQKNRAYVIIISNHSHLLGRPYLAKILRHNGTLFDIHSEAFRAICPTKIKAITRVVEWMKTNRDHDIKQFYGGEWH